MKLFVILSNSMPTIESIITTFFHKNQKIRKTIQHSIHSIRNKWIIQNFNAILTNEIRMENRSASNKIKYLCWFLVRHYCAYETKQWIYGNHHIALQRVCDARTRRRRRVRRRGRGKTQSKREWRRVAGREKNVKINFNWVKRERYGPVCIGILLYIMGFK